MIRARELRAQRVGRTYAIRRPDLDAFIAERDSRMRQSA
jgi:excisionase family DNA binding protein